MNKDLTRTYGIFLRYILIFVVGLFLNQIYYILVPITTRFVGLILGIFYNFEIIDNFIYLDFIIIEIANACVAGAAFYLLFILVFSVSDISLFKRFFALFLGFLILLFLNVLRIIVLVPFVDQNYFEFIHWIFWHIVSVIFVVSIWFFLVWLFKIKSIPFYSDLKFLYEISLKKIVNKRGNTKKTKKNYKARKKNTK